MAGAAGRADTANDGQHQILGAHTGGQPAVRLDEHAPGLVLNQALGGQYVLHLGGADPEGQGPEGPVSRGVGVPTNHRHARQRQALLGADHVHDTLAGIVHPELREMKFGTVVIQGLHLDPRCGLLDPCGAVRCWHVVVRRGDDRVLPPGLPPREPQALEGLWRGHLVDQMPINVKERRAVLVAAHNMGVPDLVVKCLAGH